MTGFLTKDMSVRSVLLTAALLLVCILAAVRLWPQPAALSTDGTAHVETPTAKTAVNIAPHRATYKFHLLSARNGSDISDVTGTMQYEWNDVCDGWAIRQHTDLRFNYANGDAQNTVSDQLTWEAKDGKTYRFNIRRVTDGKETERFVGTATRDENGGAVAYETPTDKKMTLDKNTIFPTAHTLEILRAAQSGQTLFTRRVFDGTDDEAISDTSVYILPQAAAPTGEKNPLLAVPSWPLRLAFFKIGDEIGTPDYEMALDMLSNGVARSIKLDYGDFAVIGQIEDAAPLPAPQCP